MKGWLMRKLFILFIATGFAALLSQQICCEAPRRPPMQEMRKLRERLRELNEELREAAEEARRKPDVAEAFKVVRAVEEALGKAEQHANELLDEAIINANPELADAVKERRALQKKQAERRQRFGRRRWPGWGPSEEAQEEEKPVRKDAGPDVGQEAPDFSLQTMDGEKTVKLSDSRGRKPVVLIFASYT